MLANPERLFERSWRPRHPLRRRHGPTRRYGMALLFLCLCTIIFGYIWLTNPQRVREMASAYLSDLLGGEVTIGRANLSIFEGLRLDDVTLRVDQTNRPDSILFHAKTFLVRYHPAELFTGKLAATQIIAIEPVTLLVEDPLTHRWNYQRMWNGAGPSRRLRPGQGAPLVLPEIYLREAEVAYLELRNGKTVPMGWYSLEGSLVPNAEKANQYKFELQSHGRDSMGPSVVGTLDTGGGASSAELKDFTFGPDIRSMLQAEPRQWCEWHQLQGHIDVPNISFDPGKPGEKPSFSAQLVLSDVELALHPEEWMSREENQRVQWFHHEIDLAEANQWMSRQWAATLRRLSTPEPIHLRQVYGTLTFSDKGINLQHVTGRLENNGFNIDGTLDGYSPDAPAHLTISSLGGQTLEIPDLTPDYLGSAPKEMQEIVEHLHPQGTCSMELHIERTEAGGKPTINGHIDIRDGQFQFSDFPYPICGASGQILVGTDPIAKMNGLRIVNLSGHGPAGGPNANARVTLNGFIGPLEGVAGVWMEVRGSDFNADPAIRAALPPPAQEAMALFDPVGDGRLPKFHGSFSCHVVRPEGPHKHWQIDTDIDLDDAEGELAAFPYPMKHLKGRMEIRDGYLNIVDVQMRRGDATVGIEGTLVWKNVGDAANRPLGPDIRLTARNVPIDSDLTGALPPAQRAWLQRAGVSGALDIDGRIFRPQTPATAGGKSQSPDLDYVFEGSLHDGSIHPSGADVVMSELAGKLRLTPHRLELNDVSGHRGLGGVKASVVCDWSKPQTKLSVTAAAQNLELDDALYQMLPSDARKGWDAVQPHGTVDATLELATSDGYPQRLELNIVPRNLSVMPAVLPYSLDNVQGAVSVSDDQVLLHDLTAKHGASDILVTGHGQLGAQPAWDLKVSASQVAVDDQLIRALPESVAGVFKGLKVGGTIGVEFSKLAYWPGGQTVTPGSANTSHGADLDFAAKIGLKNASLSMALPMTNVQGSIDVAGLVRDGKLYRLAGRCAAESLNFAGRPATDFKLAMDKTTDDPVVQFSHLEGNFAGGDIAGEGQCAFPDDAASKYDLSLVLRDADVQQLTTPYEKNLHGRLTASIQMDGNWEDPNSRRGHGDLTVQGDQLYNIPVMMGLLQMTNLALPISSPLSEISTRYTLDGQRVVFERIDLKGKDIRMSGSGELNFGLGRVSLWLVTNNSALVSLPVVGPLIHGADQELLKIHIQGTIQQPKVSASTFDTITTTVDQVLSGDEQR